MPRDLGGNPVAMPDPTFVVISPASNQGWMLDRFTESLELAGNTWHETEENARGQAEWEYGDRLGDWIDLVRDTSGLAEVIAQLGHETLRHAD